jgi:dihydroneopterin aldolase
MDKVFVTNLCIHGYHGVFVEEQKLGQKFFVDIQCDVDTRVCALQDDYEDTVCYGELCKIAQKISDSGPFKLIESLGDRIARDILKRYLGVSRVSVSIRKPSAPIPALLDFAGVEIIRTRGDASPDKAGDRDSLVGN